MRASINHNPNLQGINQIRQRYLDVCHRDKMVGLGLTLMKDTGNEAAHEGDCVADSLLYTGIPGMKNHPCTDRDPILASEIASTINTYLELSCRWVLL